MTQQPGTAEPRPVWDTAAVGQAERAALASTGADVLMRRAAFAVATSTMELLRRRAGLVTGRRVVLLVGAGGNGGDALWAGAFLRRRGVAVTAVLLRPERAHPSGLAALRAAGGSVLHAGDEPTGELGPQVEDVVAAADVAVDGIVGLSASGAVRPPAPRLLAAAERAAVAVVAVDVPSGVDPNTGQAHQPPHGCVLAERTVTFGGLRPAHVLGAGQQRSGHVVVADIGLTWRLRALEPVAVQLTDACLAQEWPVPGPDSDKYSQGVTGVVAGSAAYPGAAVLASSAAARATAGMVRYVGTAAAEVTRRLPELIVSESLAAAGRVQAWAIGPGLGTDKDAAAMLAEVLAHGRGVCVDADAITLLARRPELWQHRVAGAPVVLTPHDREFERIAGEPPGPDRIAAARRLARRLQACVLLKGHTTVVAEPEGRAHVARAHSSWPATAGSGDVLSGMVGALLAAGLPPGRAAACAAEAHGMAARAAAGEGGAPILAEDIVAALPGVIARFRSLSPVG